MQSPAMHIKRRRNLEAGTDGRPSVATRSQSASSQRRRKIELYDQQNLRYTSYLTTDLPVFRPAQLVINLSDQVSPRWAVTSFPVTKLRYPPGSFFHAFSRRPLASTVRQLGHCRHFD